MNTNFTQKNIFHHWMKIAIVVILCFARLNSSAINQTPLQTTGEDLSSLTSSVLKTSESEIVVQITSERSLKKEARQQFKEWIKTIKGQQIAKHKTKGDGKSSDFWWVFSSVVFILGGFLIMFLGIISLDILGTGSGYIYLGIGLMLVGIIYALATLISRKKRKRDLGAVGLALMKNSRWTKV